MAKKIEKKLNKRVASKLKVEKPKVVKLKVEESKEEIKAGFIAEPALPPPVAESVVVIQDFLPEGVLKKETVEINGRKYFKFYRKNGTTDLELLG